MKKEILVNQAITEHALFFDPVHKQLVLATDKDGNPAGRYAPKPLGAAVLENGDVEFHYYAPNAVNVQVRGTGATMGPAAHDMVKGGDGYWTAVVSGIGIGFHYYEYVVDGNHLCTDLAPLCYGPFKAINFFELPDGDSDFWLLKDVPHGTIRMDYYKSGVTGRVRNCYIYTPPGYEKNPDLRYPVLYLQHGGGESETSWIWQGKINFIMDNLLAEGKCREMLIVMNLGYSFAPDHHEHPSCGCFDEVLINDCIPFIDSKYRTIAEAEGRAMAGLSMGGFQTQRTVMPHPGIFSAMGIFSANILLEDDEKRYQDIFANAEKFNRNFPLFFVSTGDREGFLEENREIISQLSGNGIKSVFYIAPGYHEWHCWRYSVKAFLQLVFLLKAP